MSKIENIKNHVRENKKVYLVGASCLAVGLLGGVALVKTGGSISIEGTANKLQNADVNQALSWKPTANVNQVVVEMVERSIPSKPVHLVGTNLYFSSLNEAARETGHSLSKLSRHVNGHVPDLDGDVFELLEVVS